MLVVIALLLLALVLQSAAAAQRERLRNPSPALLRHSPPVPGWDRGSLLVLVGIAALVGLAAVLIALVR